jgi:hypothetical protein
MTVMDYRIELFHRSYVGRRHRVQARTQTRRSAGQSPSFPLGLYPFVRLVVVLRRFKLADQTSLRERKAREVHSSSGPTCEPPRRCRGLGYPKPLIAQVPVLKVVTPRSSETQRSLARASRGRQSAIPGGNDGHLLRPPSHLQLCFCADFRGSTPPIARQRALASRSCSSRVKVCG